MRQGAPALIEPTLINHVFVEGRMIEDCGEHLKFTFYVNRAASCGGTIRVAVAGVVMTKQTYADIMAASLPEALVAARDRPTLVVVN